MDRPVSRTDEARTGVAGHPGTGWEDAGTKPSCARTGGGVSCGGTIVCRPSLGSSGHPPLHVPHYSPSREAASLEGDRGIWEAGNWGWTSTKA